MSVKLRGCQLFVLAAVAQDLLWSEFRKPHDEQSLKSLNLYVNLTIDLALREPFIERQLERLLLSANDMEVLSDYYYLVANVLRLKVSHGHDRKVL